jgi:hypothetical protein
MLYPAPQGEPFMATAAQLTANRANAQLSTGPVTPQGKARVAQNALKHGLTSRHLVIRPDEEEEFSVLRDALEAELDPRGALETIALLEILHAAWSLHRFRRIEAEVSRGDMEDFLRREETAILDRLARYQARAQRAYYRAVHELRALQTNRALRDAQPGPPADAEPPALAEIAKLTKQTRSQAPPRTVEMPHRASELENGALDHTFSRLPEGGFAEIGS